MPTWHGSPNNLLPKYTKFLESHKARFGHAEVARLRAEQDEHTRDIEQYKESIATCREKIAICTARLEMLSQEQPDFSDEQLDELFASIVGMPEVLGSRIDSQGRLVLLLRPLRDGYDFGDFEYGFRFVRPNHFSPQLFLTLVRATRKMADAWRETDLEVGHLDNSDNESSYKTILQVYDDSIVDQLEASLLTCDFPAHVRLVLDRIMNLPEWNLDSYRTDNIPDPVWHGHAIDHIQTLRRTIDARIVKERTDKIEATEEKLRYSERWLESYQRNLREAMSSLRPIKARLAELQRKQSSDTPIDTVAAAKELRFITTKIPGVMGMRFAADGTPVLHIRTSHLHEGKRYDLGDYELKLALHPRERLGVVQMDCTRRPRHERHDELNGIYWHDTSYSTNNDWFCFGDRRHELKGLFEDSNFAQFVHVAVNTLNSVNDYDMHLLERYPVIPADEVWHNRPRNRPRRLLKAPRV